MSNRKLHILLVFTKISDFRQEIHEGFMQQLEGRANIDLCIHQLNHRNTAHFDGLMQEKAHEYDHIAVLLHSTGLNEDVLRTINNIPKEKLLILDKKCDFIRGEYACVYQDFENDLRSALYKLIFVLEKYKTFHLVKPEDETLPSGIESGFQRFCEEEEIAYQIEEESQKNQLHRHDVYLVFSEKSLNHILKTSETQGLALGKDIGLISYHENPLKEVLSGGITVLTTDYFQLGKTAGELILNRERVHIKNPFRLIQRNSL